MGRRSDGGGVTALPNYQPYTWSDWALAVTLSAILGWAFVMAPLIVHGGVGILILGALFGLPIAFLACLCIAAPILKLLMRRPISWRRAAVWGAVISAVMKAIDVAYSRYHGWRESQDDSVFSRYGGGDYVQSIDGILTPYGWWVLAQNSVIFVLKGMMVALIIRAVIGEGRRENAREEVSQ